ncbi:hypothetical protein CYLTODRAFT_363128 [Cylindrobasidium torrendii FP15055 ss-10]|uniref:Uncharacterized protein n=1 Tax=Cylindrobasidium torrendii FP15055 ss-10 TaxID=1314674 RepID=A0A0D7ATS6_9AGAR|nr:hypothetical protein CYLTODRAFT_363128 [Cylindrobasidium torrendii FP15055 ss-10]
MGEAVLKAQIEASIQRQELRSAPPLVQTALEIDIAELSASQSSPEAVVDAILQSPGLKGWGPAQRKRLWTWTRIPYHIRAAGLAALIDKEEDLDAQTHKQSDGDSIEHVSDQDEWILQNESYLRCLSHTVEKADYSHHWSYGLVQISQLPAVLAQSLTIVDSYGSTLKLERPGTLSGFCILGERRKSALCIQSSTSAFRSQWDYMTDGVLEGLDWSNIIAAGGVVLGTMLTRRDISTNWDTVHHPNEWLASDIDLYLYGLELDEANQRIKDIAQVYQSNLAPDAPFLIVRSSQTVTLYSTWPRKRVQIVLKLVQSPREVLLNFDLDPCAIGYDGKDVWMLPRFVRAIETGYTNFTMDIIGGHYLGDRKASRETRVFKYADKGFGLRFLPSYLSSLVDDNDQPVASIPPTLDRRANQARKWTRRCIEEFVKRRHKNTPSYYCKPAYLVVDSTTPVLSHGTLAQHMRCAEEPLGHSALAAFSVLMRHVALWEEEFKGNIFIYDHVFAENTYEEGLPMDNTPACKWGPGFDTVRFAANIDEFNDNETRDVVGCLPLVLGFPPPSVWSSPVQRLTYNDSVDDLFSPASDIQVLLILSQRLMDYANTVLMEALDTAGHTKHPKPLKIVARNDGDIHGPCVVVWRLDYILNWQMVDRRIDEVREILWAYHRLFSRDLSAYRTRYIESQLSKRVIRQAEFDEFKIWVCPPSSS